MSIKTAAKRAIRGLRYPQLLGRNDVNINYSVDIKSSTFEGLNAVGARSRIYNSTIGYGSYVGADSAIIGTKVGRYCSLGPDISMPTGLHPTTGFASTSPLFFSTAGQLGRSFVRRQKFMEYRYAEDGYLRVIGNDVWVGGNVVILEGVTIGDGAILGAGCVVTKNVPPYSICVGVPAKPIRYRFDQETIDRLLATKWWERGHEWVEANADSFEDVQELLELLEEM